MSGTEPAHLSATAVQRRTHRSRGDGECAYRPAPARCPPGYCSYRTSATLPSAKRHSSARPRRRHGDPEARCGGAAPSRAERRPTRRGWVILCTHGALADQQSGEGAGGEPARLVLACELALPVARESASARAAPELTRCTSMCGASVVCRGRYASRHSCRRSPAFSAMSAHHGRAARGAARRERDELLAV